MNSLKNQIAQQVGALLGADSGLSHEDILKLIEYPPESKMGDLSVACFRFSKILRKSPVAIAEDFKSRICIDGVARTEAVNGYLNFFVSDSYRMSLLDGINAAGDDYGKNDIGSGKTVCIDYSSPNIAKEFHIGHLGTTVIGNSLKRIHAFSGYKCVGINYLGDWGTQFGRLIVAYKTWADKEKIERDGVEELGRIYKEFYERAEKDPSLNDRAREEFNKMEQGDPESLRLWQWFREISLQKFMETYKLLGIDFDSYDGEGFFHDKAQEVVDELKEKNLLEESDGAMLVRLDDYNMPPCLILKNDGSSLYTTRDIAAAIYRKKTYNFDKCLYVTDAGQSLHFAQFFKVIGLMGYDWEDELVHIPYGKISVNGAKLASRTGNVVLLSDLFNDAIERVKAIMDDKNPDLENRDEIARKVGLGAVIFNQLSSGRIKDVNFVWEDALNFDGNTGPYAQYTYARSCSVLEKAGKAPDCDISDYEMNPVERELVAVLSKFPEKVVSALDDYEPSAVTRYILDLCQSFNRFYHDCPIMKASDSEKAARIKMCRAVRYTLGNALWLIGLEKTEKI